MDLDTYDRCDDFPAHVGPNVFPNFFLFSRLVRWAHKTELTAITDLTFGFKASYAQLLTDVLSLRNHLRLVLDSTLVSKIDSKEDVFINLLGPGGYEFTVGFIALVALGVVVVPISPDIPVKEAVYFAKQSHSYGVLVADRCGELGIELEHEMKEPAGRNFKCIQIRPHIMRPCLQPKKIEVSSDTYLDLNQSAYVIFTSGTTGPPKGGVKRRGFLYDVASQFADQHEIRPGHRVLHVLPVHHATGITVTLLPFLWAGGHIEFRSGGFDIAWTWERIRKADLNFFSGVPTIYMRLMQFYEQKLQKLPHSEQYAAGASHIDVMLCGTSALPRPLQQKWMKLRGGKHICTRYGGTEFGNVFTVTPWMKNVPDGSVGMKGPGIDFKLSNGDEGEVLVRTPIMFSKYLFDAAGTKNALDNQGYFKTGGKSITATKYSPPILIDEQTSRVGRVISISS
jgi:malonyl-CoA/methylmalonyl-CoA synthetase